MGHHQQQQGTSLSDSLLSTGVATILILFSVSKCSAFEGENQNYTEVPSNIPPESINVSLYNNSITHLPKGVFSSLTYCTKLNLGKNEISVIEDGAFVSLTNLHHLILDQNNITKNTGYGLDGLPKLKLLSLAFNSINHLSNHINTPYDYAFFGLAKL